MGLGVLDEEDPDMFDMADEDEDAPVRQTSSVAPPPQTVHRTGGRRLRIRPMKQATIRKYPDIVSVLMTLVDGRQVMLVRGK